MEKISSFFDFVPNLPNCNAHPNNRFFAISQLWVIESWWKFHEECVTRIDLFRPKFIGIRIYLAEISQKKKTHLPNCSACGVCDILKKMTVLHLETISPKWFYIQLSKLVSSLSEIISLNEIYLPLLCIDDWVYRYIDAMNHLHKFTFKLRYSSMSMITIFLWKW